MNPSIIPAVFTLTNRIQPLSWCFLLFGALLFAAPVHAQLFETTLGIAATQEEAQDSKPINGGKYIVLANTQSFGPANMISLTRLNAAGVQEMTVTLNDQNNPAVPYFGTAIELDVNAAGAQTGYFIAGYRKSANVNQIILMRTDLNGLLTWLKVLPPANSHDERSVSVERQSNGDVTVVGSVGSGAEIVAGGSIHVYGTLRGRAMAGVNGNASARIYCHRMEAELLAFLKGSEPTPKTFTMTRLRYPKDSHEMNDEGQEETYLLGLLLLAFPHAQLEIHGHIDRSESEQYSGSKPFAGYTLSQLRADCVYRRVVHQGVAAGRLQIFGHAATRPLTDGQTAEDKQRNRRVELVKF